MFPCEEIKFKRILLPDLIQYTTVTVSIMQRNQHKPSKTEAQNKNTHKSII